MSEHDTSPLTVEEQQLSYELAHSLVQDYQPPFHIHGPFTFLMNQNHNALRGCQSCGQTWVGLMAGDPDNIQWHPVSEPPEEEQE